MTDQPAVILNVDADPTNRSSVSRILRRAGFAVEEAGTGEEALRLAVRNPALVVLDVNLPDLNGFDVCRRIKDDPATATVPVLQLSAGFPRGEDRGELPEGGADACLAQPVEPSELLAVVRSLLRARRAEAEVKRQSARLTELEREVRTLEEITQRPRTAVTAQLYGSASLREASPDVFAELVGRYGELLRQAIERRAYKVDHPVSEQLRAMSERLGFLQAGPRDVIAVHGAALKAVSDGAAAPKVRAYLDEGRLMALELMGHLVSYYRLRSVGSRAPKEEGRS